MTPQLAELNADQVLDGWPYPAPDSDKYSRGVVGIDTGSKRYPGAALLGVSGALHAGAGMIRYLGEVNPELILLRTPSVTIGAGQIDAIVVGSGWDDQDQDRLRKAIEYDVPMVLDAGAMQYLRAGLGTELPAQSLLTPHAGELAKLLQVERAQVEADPLTHAARAAERFGACVLLKGARQYCVAPDGAASLAVPGPAWTGQAGSGDVLAGICGTLLAAGCTALQAGGLAASIQAMAAVRKPGPFPPDVIALSVAELLGAHRPLAAADGRG